MKLEGSDLVCKALDIALIAHKDQFRMGGAPYLDHPLDVARRYKDLINSALPPEPPRSPWRARGEALALLHDSLEKDASRPYTQLELAELGFPDEVVIPLGLVTKLPGETYLAYLLRLKASHNRLALDVKGCDLDSNEASAWDIPNEKIRKSLVTKWQMARHILFG
jgi:(p)ppGpp synthase/HD superfamily hydrolase